MCCRYIYMNCLWCLLWTMCDACNVYLSGVRYTWTNHKNRKYMVTLPSVTLSKEAFCRVSGLKHSAKCTSGKLLCILGLKWHLCRVSALWHSAKKPKFYVFWDVFVECLVFDTRQRTKVCRVPEMWHSAKEGVFAKCLNYDIRQRGKVFWVPRIWHTAKEGVFAECLDCDTRQRSKVCRVPRIWHSVN